MLLVPDPIGHPQMGSNDQGFAPPVSLGREIPLQLLVFGSWLIAFGAAALLEYAPNASLWFPPAAITFAAVLVLGLRILPVLWLACLIVTVLADQVFQRGLSGPELLGAGLAFGFTHTVAYGALAMLLRSTANPFSTLTTFRKISGFLLGGAVAAGISSLLGGLSLTATGMAERADLPSLIAPWWIGDYAGLITVAPLFAILLTRISAHLELPTPGGLRWIMEPIPWHRPWSIALGKLAALTLLTVAVLGIALKFPGQQAMLFLLFLCLPLQLWIVHSENTLASLLGILLFGLLLAIAAGMTALGDQALMLQFIVISLAVSSYLGLAVPALYRDNHRMRQLLTHDSLTGALGRNFFEDAAREGLRQSELRAQPACLVMIDLDNLKRINDRFGHAAGDRALKILADICSSQLAPGQLLGRLSGDEFALFLGKCSAQEARETIEAIEQKLADGPAVAGGQPTSASFGIAEFRPGTGRPDYDQLLAAADRAMYRNKPTQGIAA